MDKMEKSLVLKCSVKRGAEREMALKPFKAFARGAVRLTLLVVLVNASQPGQSNTVFFCLVLLEPVTFYLFRESCIRWILLAGWWKR